MRNLLAWMSTHAQTVDLVLAAVVTAVPLAVEATDALDRGATVDAADLVASVLAFALIALRRRAPRAVFAISLVAAAWSITPADDQIVLQVAAFLCLITLAETTDRRTAWTAGGVAALVLFVTSAISIPGSFRDDSLQPVAWMLTAAAIGDAVRSRRAQDAATRDRAEALRQRAERAEEALEEETRRQIAEERLRIARELHDVVAHHIAVITVQAGVAGQRLRTDPDAAEVALGHVRRGANTVLDELGGILRVLRRPDDEAPERSPLPTATDLDRLVASFEMAGLVVDAELRGTDEPMAAATGLTLYRVVQEALTNAQRHGTGSAARLRVDVTPTGLDVEVRNPVGPNPHAESGTRRPSHGLVGMRERVAAAGGTIETGRIDGHFRVAVALPLRKDEP